MRRRPRLWRRLWTKNWSRSRLKQQSSTGAPTTSEFERWFVAEQAIYSALMQTRRAALLTIAGAAASPLLSQQHDGHAMTEATPVVQSYDPVFFKQPEYAVVSTLAD